MRSLVQFSVRGLLYAITFLAVCIAALVNANGIWQGLVWGAALYALSAAILLIVYRRQEQRAFWLGFAVFGWLYLLLFLAAHTPAVSQFWIRSDPLRYQDLFATQLAQWSHQNLLPQSRREAQIVVPLPAGSSGGMVGMAGSGDMAMISGMMPGMGPSGGMGMPGMPGGIMPGMGMGPMGGTMMVANPNSALSEKPL